MVHNKYMNNQKYLSSKKRELTNVSEENGKGTLTLIL